MSRWRQLTGMYKNRLPAMPGELVRGFEYPGNSAGLVVAFYQDDSGDRYTTFAKTVIGQDTEVLKLRNDRIYVGGEIVQLEFVFENIPTLIRDQVKSAKAILVQRVDREHAYFRFRDANKILGLGIEHNVRMLHDIARTRDDTPFDDLKRFYW